MRILVTGASGFLGSFVVAELVRLQVETGILLRKSSNTWRLSCILDRVLRIDGDLIDSAGIFTAVRQFAPDAVIHLGWSGVFNKFRDDVSQIDKNLSPTLRLMQTAGEAGCKVWIGIGSQAEYGPANRRLDESAPTNPTTTYGAVKLSAFLLGKCLAAHYGMRFAWLRVFSTYGPKDNPNWMIPYLIRTLRAGEGPRMTLCEQRWDYLYATDAADAICRVALSPAACGAFNLGSGNAVALREIVETIRNLVNPRIPVQFGAIPYRPDQVMLLEADPGRLETTVGWRPQTSLDAGLEATVNWFTTQKPGATAE